MIELIIAALATYGISKLLVEYDGFGDVFYKLRQIELLSMLNCTVCTSVYIAIPIAFFAGVGVLGYFAILGLVILLEKAL